MTNAQALNLISKGRAAYDAFINTKNLFQEFAADYLNLDAPSELQQEHFTGAHDGIDLTTFHEAFGAMVAVLQTAEVQAATKPVYQVGRQ